MLGFVRSYRYGVELTIVNGIGLNEIFGNSMENESFLWQTLVGR